MKKLILQYALFLLPALSFAQDKNPPIVEDFVESVITVKKSVSFAFDDHLNVLALETANDKFDVLGIDDKMQQAWKTPIEAENLWIKKFKNQVLVLASSPSKTSKITGDINYTAYMIDPATGKIITNKIVYHATNELVQQPKLFTGEGDFFKLAVRIAARKANETILSDMFKSGRTIENELNQTVDLRVISYNEKLDTINTLKPVLTNGVFISLVINKQQDAFICWLNGPSMEIYKYDAGQSKPSNFLTVATDFKENQRGVVTNSLLLQPSENKNLLYYSLMYSNDDKNVALGVGKLDFSTNKKAFNTQTLDKASLKTLKKSFTPINKDLDNVDFGDFKWMSIQYVKEIEGKLIVAVAPNWIYDRYGISYVTSTMIINGYDENFNHKFAQLLPTNSLNNGIFPTIAFHVRKNELNLLANTYNGVTSNACVYASLDLNTGKWIKMYKLSKKKINSFGFSRGESVLWFGDNYIVPYFVESGFKINRYNVTFQTNFYRD